MLLGANTKYPVGSIGEQETVSLTADQNGKHTHNFSYTYNDITHEDVSNVIVDREFNGNWGANFQNISSGYVMGAASMNSSGKGAPHNNMPPYRSVYMWKRLK